MVLLLLLVENKSEPFANGKIELSELTPCKSSHTKSKI